MKGIIYCINSLNTNYIYIGCSKQPLSVRKSKHIYDSKKQLRAKPVHKFICENGDWVNYEFKIINNIECDNLKELRIKEKEVIDEYKLNSDYQLLNTR